MTKFSRKQFLKRSFMVSAALPLVSMFKGSSASPLVVPPSADLSRDEPFWASVRAQYRLDDRVVNLNSGVVGTQPIVVQEAHMAMYQRSNLAPAHFMWGEVGGKRGQLREELAELIGCETGEVAIDRNTTEALNTVIFGLDLKAGDEVVVSDFDYPFMLNAWRQRELRDDIVLRQVKLPMPLEDVQQAVELYRAAISSRTKLVHVTHMINWTGQIMPAKEITAMAHAHGCEVVVDAAHSLAHIPLSFRDIGCDYMAVSLHKWLGAPFGTGALVIKQDKIANIWPLLSAWEPKSDSIGKFEILGTRSFPAEMAVLDAMAFHRNIGLENVSQRLHFLKTYWMGKVKDREGVKLHTSLRPDFSCGIATFSVEGLPGQTIADTLFETDGIHVGVVTWNGMDAVRVSPNIFTSLEDLDRLVAALEKLTG